MADETLQQQPPTFTDELYKYAHDSGFIPKEATFDIFKKNLSNKDFVKELYDYSVQTDFIPKEATIDIFTKNIGGTNPAEKKNEKPATELPSAGGSSGLLSVKFGGDEYEVNPATQEVFKGGKPVTVPQNIKDYIAKNIIGVPDNKPKYQAAPQAPDWAAGTGTSDVISIAANQPKIEQQGDLITPDVKAVLQKNLVDTDIFDYGKNPALLEQTVKDLSDYTGTDVDLRYPETLDKAIGQAKILRDTDAFNKMAAEASMTPKQAQIVANDYAAQKFLGSEDNELYRLQKQVDEALAKSDKDELAKLQPLWEKAKKNFLDTYNNDITSLQKQIATRQNIDGVPLSPNDLEEAKKKLSLLQQQYVGFTQSPQKLADSLIKSDSSLSVLEGMLKDKTPNQKLQTIANAYMARYFLLGRKLGIKTSDIIDEGNLRFMTTDRGDKGLVEWSLDNIKNYMGYGDLDGEVTSNDRKEFAELHGKLKTLMPVLLINKSPIQAEEDKIGDVFVKTATQFAPTTKAQNMTGQQVANTLQGILSQANIDNTELSPTAIQAIDTKLKKYGWGQSLAQMGGQTAQIVVPMMIAGGLSGAAIETLALSPRTAWAARFLLNNPIGKIAKGAGQYSLGGQIAGDSSELDLGTGAAAGAVDAALDAFGGRFKMLKPWLRLKFGKKAGEVASYIATQAAKGVGEFAQESAETIYQAWRDTPEGKTTLDTLKQQFGDLDDIVKFAVGTIVMGSGMSMASDLGFDKARLDAVRRMTPEQRAKFDAAVTYFKDQDNQAAKGAIDEVLPKAKTEVLEDNIDDITEVKNKLQGEIDKVQSEEDITPYSVTVNGVTYSGTTPQELRADLDYIDYVSNKTNEELYKRKTETPSVEEADTGDVELAKPEAGVGVEGEITPEVTETTEILPQEGEVKETVEEKQDSPLKDVESTAKALDLDEKSDEELQAIYDNLQLSKNEDVRILSNMVENVQEKKERNSILDASLEDVSKIIDKIFNKEEYFLEKKEGREAKEVAEKYQRTVTKEEAKKDFKDAFFGNPNTWVADAIKMREAVRVFTENGGTFKELLGSVQREFLSDGYTEADAASVIKDKLQSLSKKDFRQQQISVAYHKAKADGSNPDLVQAVEELLAPKGESKTTQKIDETTESPTTDTVDTGTVENAPTQAPITPTQIEMLVGENKGNRRKAIMEIKDENVRKVAAKLTDSETKFFDTIYAKIDLDDPMLLELQEKLGFKKICE